MRGLGSGEDCWTELQLLVGEQGTLADELEKIITVLIFRERS